jgi:hypothetical protein
MKDTEKQEMEEVKFEWVVPSLQELDIRATSKNFIQCDGIGVPGEDYACFS